MQCSNKQFMPLYDPLKATHCNGNVIFTKYDNQYFLGLLTHFSGCTPHLIWNGCLLKNTDSTARHSGHTNIFIYSIKRDRTLLRCIKSNYGLTVLSRGHRKHCKSHLCVDQMRCMCYSITSRHKRIANPQYRKKSANEFSPPSKILLYGLLWICGFWLHYPPRSCG